MVAGRAPIVAAFPGLAVLRLLRAFRLPALRMGGRVTYLAEPLPRSLAATRRRRVRRLGRGAGTLKDDALRLPWATPGGPAADLEWACAHVERTGPPIQHRTWNLSAIWSIPTATGEAWLKSRPAVLSSTSRRSSTLLERPPGPEAHRCRRATASSSTPCPGEDGYGATLENGAC